jgi:predicted  nucleic acid-binding Zn-ribbon protein
MAQAEVEIIYKANAQGLEVAVGKITQTNDELVKGATETSKKVADEFKKIGGAAAAAFGSQQVKAALDQLNKESDKLTTNLKELQKEQVLLVASGNRVSKAYQDNAKAQQILKVQISQVNAEQQELNRTYGETETKQKSLTGQLRALKQELSLLESQGKENTEEFENLLFTAARLEDQIGDTRERVRVLASDTFKFDAAVGATQALASGFEVAQGAAALFGSEGKELQEVIAKTTAVTAIANGVNDLAQQITGQGALKLALLAAGQKAVAVATAISTGAISAFRVALAATGIVAFVGGVALLVDRLKDAADNQAALNRSLELSKQAAEGSRKAIQDLRNLQLDAVTRIRIANGQLTQAEADRTQVIAEQTKIIQDKNKVEIGATIVAVREQKRLSAELAEAQEADRRASARTGQEVISQETKTLATQLATQESLIKASQERVIANNITLNTTIGGINDAFRSEELAKQREEAKKLADERAKQAEADAKEIAKVQKETFRNLLNETAALQSEFDKEQADKRKASEAKLQIELTDLADTSLQTQLDTRIAFLQRLEIEEGTSLDRRINIIELEAKKRQDNIRNTVDDTTKANQLILLDEAQTQEAIRAERKKSTDQAIDQAFQIAQAVADTLGSIIELQGIQSEKRIEEINANSEAEKLAIESSTEREVDKQRQLDALNTRTQLKISAERTKQAKAEKASAIFQAIIGTAAAVAKAGNPVLAAIALTAGLAQIAIISATPIPKFKKGGPVGGRSHEAGGTLIEAERGEYVVNKTSVSQHRKALDAMNTSSAAFKKFIDEKYVRPAIAGYSMNNKRDGITVNASLNSKSMERELKGLRKDMRNKNTVINLNGGDSRYSWQQN